MSQSSSPIDTFLAQGRWIFAIPFAIFGLFHLMDAQGMTNLFVPAYMPAKTAWVYVSGIFLISATVSMLIGKYDKLATTMLAFFLLLMVILVHVPGAMSGTERAQNAMWMLMKDCSLAGAAMMYALNYAKDRSVTG